MEEQVIMSDTTWHEWGITSDTATITSDTENNHDPNHDAVGLVAGPIAPWEGSQPYILGKVAHLAHSSWWARMVNNPLTRLAWWRPDLRPKTFATTGYTIHTSSTSARISKCILHFEAIRILYCTETEIKTVISVRCGSPLFSILTWFGPTWNYWM